MKRWRGFTLVELLASMTLATILALTVLTVLGGISRAETNDRAVIPTGGWSEQLVDRIRDDLLNSRSLHIESSGFSLDGYCRLAPAGGEADQFPVHVRYHLVTLAGHPSLLREQRALLNHAAWRDLACTEIQQITLTKLDLPATPGQSPLVIPPRVRLQIRSTDPAVPALDRVLVLRDP